MPSTDFPDTPQERLRWALRESLVIAGILAFWLLVAFVVSAAFGLLTVLLGDAGRYLYHPFTGLESVWTAIVPLAFATTALYVFVRGGTILVDRYQRG